MKPRRLKNNVFFLVEKKKANFLSPTIFLLFFFLKFLLRKFQVVCRNSYEVF